MKPRRVGTFTLGALLIIFGALFLLRIFFEALSYDIIFRLWPIIFICLGSEILIANYKQNDEKSSLVYDKAAIALIFILSFFAIGMAITEVCIDYVNLRITMY
ncbi:MAG: hypothetical protein GX359_11345 [Clostridiales bacterium]|nr:hypothetical protein [Clostridiales bacterium]